MSGNAKPLAADPLPIKHLGEIFIEKGLLTPTAVQRLVEHSKRKGFRLGELLEVIGLVTPEELAQALATQYRCRTISDFARYNYSPQVLALIPMDLAVENTIFPLKLDNGKLGLAVADPTTNRLFNEIAARHRVSIVPFVATATDINRAIARHYMGQNITEDAGSRNILLVEDDELVRTSVTGMLHRKGYDVETAFDGMDAFKKIFTHKPKLVITDKVMPKLNGYEFLYAMRKIPEFRFTPAILMTSAPTPEEEKEALEKGFFDFILKPVKEIGLLTRVKRAFQSMETIYGKTG